MAEYKQSKITTVNPGDSVIEEGLKTTLKDILNEKWFMGSIILSYEIHDGDLIYNVKDKYVEKFMNDHPELLNRRLHDCLHYHPAWWNPDMDPSVWNVSATLQKEETNDKSEQTQ